MAPQTARVAMTSTSYYQQTHQWLERCANIARKFGFESGTYGTSEDWPLIWLRRLRHDEPLLYLSAGIHGDEPAGVEALISELESAPAWLGKFSLLLCPVLNPAGCASGSRFDSAGRDLNRDYRKCLSPATRAHRNFLELQPTPKLCLSFHEDWETKGFYLYEINTSQHPCVGPQILTTIEASYQLEKNTIIDGHQVISRG
jgi:protein MpaA